MQQLGYTFHPEQKLAEAQDKLRRLVMFGGLDHLPLTARISSLHHLHQFNLRFVTVDDFENNRALVQLV